MKTFQTGYFHDLKMEASFQRIFVKSRPFCSHDMQTPPIAELPSYVLIDGGIMILNEDVFRQELAAALAEKLRTP
jgi:hypothetical protein